MEEQSALSQLMRLVGCVPQPTTSRAATNCRGNESIKSSPAVAQRSNSTKPITPMGFPQMNGKSAAAIPDPRLLFPAAMAGGPFGVGKPPAMAAGFPPMPPLNKQQQQQLQMQMQLMGTPQMPPGMPAELMALQYANMAAAQYPAMMAKFYNEFYTQMLSQQYMQSLLLQQAMAASTQAAVPVPSPQVNSTKVSPTNIESKPKSTRLGTDPLASLQNMVHGNGTTAPTQSQSVPAQTSSPASAPTTSQSTPPTNRNTPIVPIEEEKPQAKEEPKPESECGDLIVDEEEEELVDVERRDEEPNSRTIPTSGSFSIADILQNNLEYGQMCRTPNTANSSASSEVSNFDAQSMNGDSTADRVKKLSTASVGGGKCRMAQRKKHIEFHRRMKGINGRSKYAQCQLCGKIVTNNSSELTNHVYGHSSEPLFGCLSCSSRFQQRGELFKHYRKKHPKENPDMFDDLRDMTELCDLLEKCFPRNAKLVIDTLLVRLIGDVAEKESLKCRLCEKDVTLNVVSLKNHLTQHPQFRCKLCHYLCDDEADQLRHGRDVHSIAAAAETGAASAHYNVTSAAVVLSGVLTRCFGEYMPADQLEFAEEMSLMDRAQDSPPAERRSPIPMK